MMNTEGEIARPGDHAPYVGSDTKSLFSSMHIGRCAEPICSEESVVPEPFATEFFEPYVSHIMLNNEVSSDQDAFRVQQLDEDIVDSIIARCFEDEGSALGEDGETLSQSDFSILSLPPDGEESALAAKVDAQVSMSPLRSTRKHIHRKELEIALGPTPSPLPLTSTDVLVETPCKRSGITRRGIRKSKRGRAPARPWTEEEHRRFEESLELFGRNWEQCAAYIGTRRAQLVRSHAQKHLIKLWKLGKPLPKKVAESGDGYTLSGKPLLADSASARSYLTKIPCPIGSSGSKTAS